MSRNRKILFPLMAVLFAATSCTANEVHQEQIDGRDCIVIRDQVDHNPKSISCDWSN